MTRPRLGVLLALPSVVALVAAVTGWASRTGVAVDSAMVLAVAAVVGYLMLRHVVEE